MIRFAPTLSCGLIERYRVSSQPRAVYRNGLDVSAPTGHRSIILPDSSESTVCPTKAVISACSPRPSIPSSITPAISLPKRKQRASIFMEDDALGFGVARMRFAVANRKVLQLAFAALIADRTIERMVDQ